MESDYHNQILLAVTHTLWSVIEARSLGRFWKDRMLLTNTAAGLSTEPDGTFAAWETLRRRRLRRVGGKRLGGTELVGTPDMVLEVVSPSSVRKDTVVLPKQYRRAGIPEFWLVDPRDGLTFHIFRLTPAGYRAVRPRDGWRTSAVFGAAFRLTQSVDPLGEPAFVLEVK
jgi:Uma2 family endonuclease